MKEYTTQEFVVQEKTTPEFIVQEEPAQEKTRKLAIICSKVAWIWPIRAWCWRTQRA
jgi:hypothetical protein